MADDDARSLESYGGGGGITFPRREKALVPLDGNGATLRSRGWAASRRVHHPHRPPTPHLTLAEPIQGEPEDEEARDRRSRLERDADKLERALVRKFMSKEIRHPLVAAKKKNEIPRVDSFALKKR